MANILRKLEISEISSVDKGAGRGCDVIIMKRDQASREIDRAARALRKSCCSIADDDSLSEIEKNAAYTETLQQYDEWMLARFGDAYLKTERGIAMDIVNIAKSLVAGTATDVPEKHVFLAAIEKRSEKLRKDGETKEGAFTKAIKFDPECRLLLKAMAKAPGSEIPPWKNPPAGDSADTAGRLTGPDANEMGPAATKLHVLAEHHLAKNPSMKSLSASKAAVMRSNPYLAQDVLHEEMQRRGVA